VDAKQRGGFSTAGNVLKFCGNATYLALMFRATDLRRSIYQYSNKLVYFFPQYLEFESTLPSTRCTSQEIRGWDKTTFPFWNQRKQENNRKIPNLVNPTP